MPPNAFPIFVCFYLSSIFLHLPPLPINTEESKNQEQTGQPGHQDKIFSNDELSALIDPILSSDDHNRDGFIDYPEFVRAQHKAAAQQQQEGPPQQ